MAKRVITFGTFDLLHEGHLNILRRAKSEGDYLIVGVSSDQLNDLKGKRTFFPQSQRLAYISALKYVDEVFLEESLELKDEYIKRYNADLLIMGDDWRGKFDWVSCAVKYLPRTDGISSTIIKTNIKQDHRCYRALFGDTYLDKHMDCALAIVNELTDQNIAPIFTKENTLPRKINSDILVYFNKPINDPFPEYDNNQRLLIDHGASHLKWFLGSKARFDFFDVILTAGPDHVRALEAIFGRSGSLNKARAVGFIKSAELYADPRMSRAELCEVANLDPEKPIILFAPTWHITANEDIVFSIEQISRLANHVASLHPETAHLPVGSLNIVRNINGITTELIKHADVVISDLSSTIYEAAALDKPVVQILLKEYPDNLATVYDFPLSAGTAEHFCGGLTARPENLLEAVNQALSGDPSLEAMMQACRKRILAGTYIKRDTTNAIACHIAAACEDQARRPLAGNQSTVGQPEGTPRYRRNIFFAQNRLIAHGGGDLNHHHASNSKEAMEAGLAAVNIVELDFCLGKDGLIIAHDGFESKYGLSSPFSETTSSSFLERRFEGSLTPVTLSEAIRRCTRNGKALVCDIKPTNDSYKSVATLIRDAVKEYGQIEQTVIQCYSVDDFVHAMHLGFHRVMLPVWKYYYKDPLGSAAFDFFDRCLDINADAVWGLSLPYTNKHLSGPITEHPDFQRLFGYWKRIFIHGAPVSEYSNILKINVGLFADRVNNKFEFRDAPKDFNWKQYLFLNKDLFKAGKDTEIDAIEHYLRYGRKEGRIFKYDIPEGFNYSKYINANSDLRRQSVNAFDSAAAHYTLIGKKKGLKF